MAENNFLLFQRYDQDQDPHEDVWDDTALIQAYDQAVNLAKEKVASQLNLEDKIPKSTSSTNVSDDEQSGSPLKSTKNDWWHWKVGDFVRLFPRSFRSMVNNGVRYEAIIIKIEQDNSSCLIKYLGYDNEEVVFSTDLIPSAGVAARRQQVIDSQEPESSSDECHVFQAPSQAYDQAVNLAKEKVASQLNLEDKIPKSTSSTNVSDDEQSGSPLKSTKNESWNWKVGDYVRSLCSMVDNGVKYEAIIIKIEQDNSSCLLRYLGYENEEVVFLRDLIPSAGVAARRQQVIHSQAPESSSDEWHRLHPSKPPSVAGLDWKPAKPEPLPKFPGISNMSSIPPPPPPTAWPTAGSAEMDSDSLYSMLMSWYMAGYHTGYYQGVQQRNKRKSTNSGSP